MFDYEDIAESIGIQGFSYRDNFLAPHHYLALQAHLERTYSEVFFKPAEIGKTSTKAYNASVRNDRIYWLQQQGDIDSLNAYWQAMDKVRVALNRILFLGLWELEAHFSVYGPGNFYKKHIDQFVDTSERRISCVYYLNKDWQEEYGGALRLYNTSEELLVEVKPEGNRFICFTSDLPHEVCLTHQTRYSIAGWMKVRPMLPIK